MMKKMNRKETLKIWLGALLLLAESAAIGCKKLPKKAVALCVAAAVLAAMVPAYVFAAETTYNVWVGGVQVTSANKDDITTAITEAGGTANGTATYDPESEILTLSGFSYTGQGYVYDSPWCAAIFAKNDLAVKVVGSNTVTASVTDPYTAEALNVWGALTITGDSGSSLTLTGAGREGVGCGGNLKIENVTVNATGTNGLYSYEGITINNAIVTAVGTDYDAISSEKAISITNSSVEATSTYIYGSGICIGYEEDLTIVNSTLTASGELHGIRVSSGSVNVTNSLIEITAQDGFAIKDTFTDVAVSPCFIGGGTNYTVIAGDNSASAAAADATLAATYENKYVKIEPPKYDLWIAGVQVTGTNLVIDSTDCAEITSGSATFDPDTNTLTLKDFCYEGEGYLTDFKVGGSYFSAAIFSDFSLTVLLEGDSVITHVNTSDYGSSCGIASSDELIVGDAPADGVGTLTVTADTYCYTSAALYAFHNLTITGGVINATADEALSSSSAILSNFGDLTISGGKVTALSQYSEYYSFGLVAYGKIIVSDATVKATSGDAEEVSAGIYTFSAGVEISNSNVEATGGKVGICSEYDLTISDSTVTAEGTEIGIYAYSGYLTISGENTSVTATGAYCGIYSEGESITVTDATVKATATDEYGIGIVADTVIVTNATVEAIGTGESGYGMTFHDDPTLNGTLVIYEGDDAGTAVRTDDPAYNRKYIKIAVPYCDVTVNYGIDGIDNKVITIVEGDTVSLDNPLFDGYVFMGWFTDADFTTAFDFDTPITAATTVYAKLADYEGDKAALQDAIDALETAVGNVETALNNKVSTDKLTEEVGKLNQAIADARTYADTQDAALKTTLEAADATMNAAIDALTTRVQDLEADLAAANSKIDTNTSDVTALKSDVATLNTWKNEAQSAITALQTLTGTQGTDISRLKVAVQDLEAELAASRARIDDAEDRIAALEGKVSALEIAKQNLDTAVAALDAAIANKADTATLNQKVTDLIAAIAAAEDAAKTYADGKDTTLKSELTTAIATAKGEAITAAENLVNTAKAELQTVINNKADIATLNAKVAELNAAIATAEATVKAYTDSAVTTLNAAIITAKDEAVDAAKDLVDAAKAQLQAAIDNKADTAAVNAAIANLQNAITALENAKDNYIAADAALKAELEAAIAKAKQEAIDAAKGYIPYIGTNGNWWIGDTDTGVKAVAEQTAQKGTDTITVVSIVLASVALLSNLALVVWIVTKKKKVLV